MMWHEARSLLPMKKLHPADVRTFTDEQWKRYYELRRRLAERIRNSLDSGNWWVFKRRTIKHAARLKHYRWAAVTEGDELVGYTSMHTVGADGSGEHLQWYFDTFLSGLPGGFIRRMARWVLRDFPPGGYAILPSFEKRNDALAKALRGKMAARRYYYTLKVKDAERATMKGWIREGQRRKPDLRLRCFDAIPERFLEEYCSSFAQLLKDMPHGSAAWLPVITPERTRAQQRMNKRRHCVVYSYLLFGRNDRIVGHTNVFINRKKPQIAFQFMTGVRKEYRGSGLARWMKAAMFRKLIRDFSGLNEIRTDCGWKHSGMISINEQMGYRYSHMLTEFKIRERGFLAVLAG